MFCLLPRRHFALLFVWFVPTCFSQFNSNIHSVFLNSRFCLRLLEWASCPSMSSKHSIFSLSTILFLLLCCVRLNFLSFPWPAWCLTLWYVPLIWHTWPEIAQFTSSFQIGPQVLCGNTTVFLLRSQTSFPEYFHMLCIIYFSQYHPFLHLSFSW